MKRCLCLFLTVVLLFLFAACAAPSPAAQAGLQASPASDGDDAFAQALYLENAGRMLAVSERPQRVLTLGPNCTELFAALGLDSLVVGRSLVNHSRGPLEEYAQAVNAIPILNQGSATREAILSSGADFIYALDWEISDEGCNLEEAAQYGMTVYVNSAASLEEQYQEIRDIGAVFGVTQAAEALIADQQARIEAVG